MNLAVYTDNIKVRVGPKVCNAHNGVTFVGTALGILLSTPEVNRPLATCHFESPVSLGNLPLESVIFAWHKTDVLS